MKYAIVYSSQTGNTKRLADAILTQLPKEDVIYTGSPDEQALQADFLYIGFWTDKGDCDGNTLDFLQKVREKQLFLFGTAGFGKDPAYFDKVLNTVSTHLEPDNVIAGTYMCQGKMPPAVRKRQEKMLLIPEYAEKAKGMIANFDAALSHPDEADLERLKRQVSPFSCNLNNSC